MTSRSVRPVPGRRAAVAVVSVEREEVDPTRALIRVKTIGDVVSGDDRHDVAFSTSEASLQHLREWLEGWLARP